MIMQHAVGLKDGFPEVVRLDILVILGVECLNQDIYQLVGEICGEAVSTW